MNYSFRCPAGHGWDLTLDDKGTVDEQNVVCPMCGAIGSIDPKDQSTVIHATIKPMRTAPSRLGGQSAPEGTDIPGYSIESVLGQGGMGRVYKARHKQLNRLVALKMILAGIHATPQQLARFQLEAESLASLQHPNIVQIYEIGEYAHCPFLALEFVEGGNLDKKMAGQPMPCRDAAAFVAKLARAIHAAHQRGIVHRDLKPANVLLTKDNEPKITDFGLAKRLEEENSQTMTGVIMGTPSYMAPEQAEGDVRRVGPLVDIYALGAILYEMMTGRPPFSGGSTLETLELVRQTEPTPPRRLQSKIPLDLETICLKCLQKDPQRRYSSGQALAEDLERYLNDEPIQARPVGRIERMAKWIKRRPAHAALAVVSTVAALTLGLLGWWFSVTYRRAAEEAEAKFDLARMVVDDMYTNVAEDWLAEEPHRDPLRRTFLEKALRVYREFAREKSDDPSVRKEMARAWFRMGQIHRALAEFEKADAAYAEAITLQSAMLAEFPDDRAMQQDLADTYTWRGELARESGRSLEAAEKNYQHALELQNQLLNAGEVPEIQRELGRSWYNLGIIAMERNKLNEAATCLDKSVESLQLAWAKNPQVPETIYRYACACINRGVLHKRMRNFVSAETDYRKANLLLTPQKGQRQKVKHRRELAVSHQNLGNLLGQQGKYAEAIEELSLAKEILDRLVTEYPNQPTFGKKLSNTLNSLGSFMLSAGKVLERHTSIVAGPPASAILAGSIALQLKGEKCWQEAETILMEIIDEIGPEPAYQHQLGQVLGNLGWLKAEKKDLAAAKTYFQRAVELHEEAVGDNREHISFLRDLGNQYRNLAEVSIQLGDHREAVEAATKMAELFPNQAQDSYFAACFIARAANLLQSSASNLQPAERTRVLNEYKTLALAFLQQAAEHKQANFVRLPDELKIFALFVDDRAFQRICVQLNARRGK